MPVAVGGRKRWHDFMGIQIMNHKDTRGCGQPTLAFRVGTAKAHFICGDGSDNLLEYTN